MSFKVLYAWNAPVLPDGVSVDLYTINRHLPDGSVPFPPHTQPGTDLCAYVDQFDDKWKGEQPFRVIIYASTSDNGFTKLCARDFLSPP